MSTNDDNTRIIRRGEHAPNQGQPTPPVQTLLQAGADPEETILRGVTPPAQPGHPMPPLGNTSGDVTVLVRPGQRGQAERPVVGWLVIVKGPGRGASLPLSYGKNFIGRDPGSDVHFGFGDNSISRIRHAVLWYDGKTREFGITDGDSKGLIYVNGSRLLDKSEIKGGEMIELSTSTTVKFVPLCGPDFDWDDEAASPA